MRSVHIGCSRYSRRCCLMDALSFHRVMERGPGQGRSRRNSTICLWCIPAFPELCRSQSLLLCIVEWLVCLATDPEMMQQHCQLAGHGDDCAFLSAFTPVFGQLESPASQIGVLSERPQDVLSSLHQHHPQIGVSPRG